MAIYNNYNNPGNNKLNTHRATRNDILGQDNNLNPSSQNVNSLLQTTTNIFIYANNAIVGMIQSFSVSENRTINKLQAVGYEGVVQAVPGNTNGGTLNVSRIALYNSNIWNALGLTNNAVPYNPVGSKIHAGNENDNELNNIDSSKSGHKVSDSVNRRIIFKTLKDQRVPLEIQVKTRKSGSTDDFFIETYVDCWLSNYSKSYSVGTITVAETAQIQYADVY